LTNRIKRGGRGWLLGEKKMRRAKGVKVNNLKIPGWESKTALWRRGGAKGTAKRWKRDGNSTNLIAFKGGGEAR